MSRRLFFYILTAIIISAVIPNFSSANSHKNLCGGVKTKAVQCQSGKGVNGNGFYDPQMNPRFNPNVDPRFNPQADPRFNPKADPRFNPGAKPCDLGIAAPGKKCPTR
jgi:hypothetical protein